MTRRPTGPWGWPPWAWGGGGEALAALDAFFAAEGEAFDARVARARGALGRGAPPLRPWETWTRPSP
jgi:hypothetical protein